MKRGGLLNIHICEQNFQISPMRQQKLPVSIFSHFKSMGTISCYSNQNSYSTGIKKNTFYIEVNVINMYATY